MIKENNDSEILKDLIFCSNENNENVNTIEK